MGFPLLLLLFHGKRPGGPGHSSESFSPCAYFFCTSLFAPARTSKLMHGLKKLGASVVLFVLLSLWTFFWVCIFNKEKKKGY